MHPHLTSEQMDRVLHDPKARAASLHLQVCAECKAEVEQLQSVFDDLRTFSAEGAMQQRRRAVPLAPRRSRAAWAYAAAAGLALAAAALVPVAMHRGSAGSTQAVHSVPHVQQPVSDETLLNSIQDDLSAAVPEAMQPLAATPSQSTSTSSRKD